MEKVKLVQDESDHWYIIPNNMLKDFLNDNENGAMIDSGEFDERWGKYRTGGDLNNIQLYAEIQSK